MGNVELRNVTKRFGDTVAVEDISLDIEDGELVALLGPSGCGKTTTLRMISGLEYPSEGRVIIAGQDVTGMDPRHRDIAMVFQDLALYPHKSVRQNMGFALSQRGHDSETISQRVEKTAEILEISELLDRMPGQLSGGQQQRVALGRAIVRDPEVFLLDEPLASLDAQLRDQMRTEILELHRELDVTMVYVTHDQEIAMTLGDRIAVMNDGHLMQMDSPDAIYQRPANEFVARFIGSPNMNVFDAEVVRTDDGIALEMNGFSITLNSEVQAEGSWDRLVGERVRLGIRPQNIHHPEFTIRRYEEGEIVTGSVRIIEELGSVDDVHMEIDGTTFIARLDPNADFTLDGRLDVVFDTRNLHVFDAETGDRINTVDYRQAATAD